MECSSCVPQLTALPRSVPLGASSPAAPPSAARGTLGADGHYRPRPGGGAPRSTRPPSCTTGPGPATRRRCSTTSPRSPGSGRAPASGDRRRPGKATVPLAARGYAVTAVELGEQMAAVARRNLAGFPAVRVEVAPFEAWPLPAAPFDAVVSGHRLLLGRSGGARREGGRRPAPRAAPWPPSPPTTSPAGQAAFFTEVQACYERWDPATPPGLRPARPGGDPVRQRGARPLGPVRAGRLPALRVGAGVPDRRLPGRPAHLLRPPGARPGAAPAASLDCLAGLLEARATAAGSASAT